MTTKIGKITDPTTMTTSFGPIKALIIAGNVRRRPKHVDEDRLVTVAISQRDGVWTLALPRHIAREPICGRSKDEVVGKAQALAGDYYETLTP